MTFATNVEFDLDSGQTLDNQGALDVDSGTVTIRDGILAHSGTLDVAAAAEIAIDGIFYLKSLLLKSSLGEGHAH